ncbi:MAG: hypothetical protein JHC52_05185 [Chthoniobacterales bacterium]|nr:hypothetical protein [Chthoniobacterales bacterium]
MNLSLIRVVNSSQTPSNLVPASYSEARFTCQPARTLAARPQASASRATVLRSRSLFAVQARHPRGRRIGSPDDEAADTSEEDHI